MRLLEDLGGGRLLDSLFGCFWFPCAKGFRSSIKRAAVSGDVG